MDRALPSAWLQENADLLNPSMDRALPSAWLQENADLLNPSMDQVFAYFLIMFSLFPLRRWFSLSDQSRLSIEPLRTVSW